MTYWIYSMGLPIPIRDDRLLVTKEVKPLSALTKSHKVTDTEEATYRPIAENRGQLQGHMNFINATYQDQTKEERKLVFFVDEIMSKPAITLSENISYDEAKREFQRHKFHHFPIMSEDNRLVGIISDRDMLANAALHEKDRNVARPVNAFMSKSVVTASPKTYIREIAQVMLSQYISAMPITNDSGGLLGIVTRSDILKTMIKNEPIEFWI
ncbi:CBS domain-containing protein [Colwelliaceae bacterium 6471]